MATVFRDLIKNDNWNAKQVGASLVGITSKSNILESTTSIPDDEKDVVAFGVDISRWEDEGGAIGRSDPDGD